MLNVGSTVGSFDKQALETELTQLKDALTLVRIQFDRYKAENVNLKRRYEELSKSNAYSCSTFTAKINALTAENAKLKTELSGKKSSGSTASEKPKVLASGMYTNSSKYVPPLKRANWVKPTLLLKKMQVTFQEPPRTSNRPTQKPPVQQNKKPNVPVNLSTRNKPATNSQLCQKPTLGNHRILPSKSVNARRAADHNRKLHVVDHNQFVIRSLKSVNTKTPMTHIVSHHIRRENQLQTVTVVDCVTLDNARQSATGVERGVIGQMTVEKGPWLQRGGNATGRACVIRDAEQGQGPNVVAGTFLLNNRYASVLFDSGSDKSFVNTSFSQLIDIKPVRLNTSYEVELADGKIVSTNTVLRGCTLNLINHLFKIDLMPIELGTFDIIIGIDWLVKRDAVIVCGKKEVHIPVKNEMLVVKSNKGMSRLKVISCIKARKYVEKGIQLFLAYVTEKEPSEKRLQDVHVICDFPEVFPDDLPGPPPPRQVEFRMELVPGATLVAHAVYRLAPSEMKKLSDQLKELSKKGFIHPSSSPWGAPVLFVKKKDGSF
ncbi:putative reverse transcriptase domain-containing protein [Tanacetum coccineum]